jgi:iron complex outermembrane recepter protein
MKQFGALTGSVQTRSAVSAFALALSLAAVSSPAFAQEADNADEPAADEIVVTGTLVRGAAPTGTTVIGVDREGIQSTGASTVTQLLQTVPQLQSFNSLQTPVGGTNSVTTNRPNLRNLPSSNLNGAASTLILVDGHRVVGMGIQTTSPDLDTIAPGAIERVDIVPDGGSSIYGADAVGGVINFITRRTFDGVGVDGRFGFADNYKTWDVNATVGKTWDGGGIYVSYNHSQHDALFGRDLDYVRQFPTRTPAINADVAGIDCRVPNVQQAGNPNIYGLPFSPNAAAKLNLPNQCDYSDDATVYPVERRHSVFASLVHDLSDSLSFELKGFFTDRRQRSSQGAYHTNKTVSAPAQFAIGTPGESQRVSFAWGPTEAAGQTVHLQSWGITPTFIAKLGGGWQVRALMNYGESTTTAHQRIFNDTALNNAISAGLFNVYAPESSNPAALAAIANWETFGQAKQSQLQARVIADGSLFDLPGGAVKVAIGAEYLRETLRTQKGNAVPGFQTSGFAGQSIGIATIIPAVNRLPIFHADRDVKSVFGEVVAPLLSDVGGFQELTFSASARYDEYSDFGDTFNPKFGVTWKPFDQLRIRGQWGKSFSAPSLANSADADPSAANWNSGFVFGIFVPASAYSTLAGLGYAPPVSGNSNILTVSGGSNSLKPQTAQTWSVGADLDPVPGARLSATYWNVKYEDLIASPLGTAAGNPTQFLSQFLTSYKVNPTQADINAALASATIVNNSPCTPQPTCLYMIGYYGTQNLGKFHQDGIDFALTYNADTSFGSIDASWAGTYILNRKQSIAAAAPLIDQIPAGFSRLSWRTQLGANIGQLRAQAAWNHTHGYDFTPGNAALAGFYPAQNHIGSFNTVDLFFKYDFDGEGVMKDLALTLNVNNLLDTDPPVRYIGGGATPAAFGYANGLTIGRLIQVGFSKKF